MKPTLSPARGLGPVGARVMVIVPRISRTGAYDDVAPEQVQAQCSGPVQFPQQRVALDA